MRLLILALTILLLSAPAAVAAPTCRDVGGDTLRCGTAGAMPVGWTPSPALLSQWRNAQSPGAGSGDLLKAICTVALFLALIALLPEFDGTRAADWDRQEGDDEERD
jgi:hypothetical protein